MMKFKIDLESPDGRAGDTVVVEAKSADAARTKALADCLNPDWVVVATFQEVE